MAEFYFSAFADEAASDLHGQISALKDNGISYIEPRFIDKRGVITLSDEELMTVKAELDCAGIKVGSLGSPLGKFPIDGDFDEQLSVLDTALRACEILGAKRMRMFSFYIPNGEYDKYRDEVIKRLSQMVQIASSRGITLCHENEEGIYGQDPERVSDLLTSVDGLGGIFDPANYCVVGDDAMDGFNATLPHLEYLHIKDALTKGKPGTESGMVILPAGEGDGRIGEVLDMVNEATNGKIMLTLEPHLYTSDAFLGVDDRALAKAQRYSSEREAFDAAADALHNLLCSLGYEKSGIYYKKLH